MIHRHVLADLWLPTDGKLRTPEPLWPELLAALDSVGVQILNATVHRFQPAGFTGFALLAQSHASIHSWPEDRLLLLDVQLCGDGDPLMVVERIVNVARPTTQSVRIVQRG